MQLVRILARYFVQSRAHWQRAALMDDLEGEGFLALTRAARTYDPKKLPYPKAYFARAILNGMLKFIKRATRQPGKEKVSLAEAADLLPILENPDYLRMAITDLPASDRAMAVDRFQNGHTLRTIADDHRVSLRIASIRSRLLARTLADALGIRLAPPAPATARMRGDSNRWPSSASPASADRRHRGPRQ